jgi:hypothetical protein
MQIRLINSTIVNANPAHYPGHPLYRKLFAQDPSEKLIGVHLPTGNGTSSSATRQDGAPIEEKDRAYS